MPSINLAKALHKSRHATGGPDAITPADIGAAPSASPAFTGTPTGITKAHVGLGSVDDTSDAGKPVSTAQGVALGLKLDTTVANATYAAKGLPQKAAQLQDQVQRGKLGRIGTGGKPVVAFRIDHQLDQFLAKVKPLLVARRLPWGHGLVTQSVGQPTGGPTGYEPTTTTWAQVVTDVFYPGGEIWSHSRTHGDRNGDYVSEIVGARADIVAQGLLPIGWQQPGGPATYGAPHVSAEGMDDAAGRLIRDTYALYESSVVGTTYRFLPTDGCRGLNHITVESITLATIRAFVDSAIKLGTGLEIMIHPNQLDVAGLLSTANLALALDYVVAKRDAGLLEVLTPSGLAFADPGVTYRPSLIADGSFESGAFTSEWTSTGATIQTDGGHTGTNYMRATGGSSSYSVMAANGYGIPGHVMEFRAWVRATATGGGTAHFKTICSTLAGSKYPVDVTWVLTQSDTWQEIRVPFGVELATGNMYLVIACSAGTSVDFDDIRLIAT